MGTGKHIASMDYCFSFHFRARLDVTRYPLVLDHSTLLVADHPYVDGTFYVVPSIAPFCVALELLAHTVLVQTAM